MDEKMSPNQIKKLFKCRERGAKIFKNKHTLETSYIPDQLPEREKEIEKLVWHLKGALEGNTPKNVFIYGYPGVGKTACCKKVLRALDEEIRERKISNINTMYLNCAATHTECQVIAEIANFFTTKQLAPRRGWGAAEYYRFFGNTLDDFSGIFIIVLDEVDNLVPENELVLYNLTRAKDHILSNAKISLIGISNDLKFFDELDPRIQSSMCQREIIINPYTAPQLEKILTQRAKEAFAKEALGESVIPLCAAFAAQDRGDARKAIDLLSLAGELAEARGGKHIREEDARAAHKELEKRRLKEVIKGLPIQPKTALLAIAQLAGDKGTTITGKAYERYKILTHHTALSTVTPQRFKQIVDELSMARICKTRVLTRGCYGRTTNIKLAVPLTEVESVLYEDKLLAPVM